MLFDIASELESIFIHFFYSLADFEYAKFYTFKTTENIFFFFFSMFNLWLYIFFFWNIERCSWKIFTQSQWSFQIAFWRRKNCLRCKGWLNMQLKCTTTFMTIINKMIMSSKSRLCAFVVGWQICTHFRGGKMQTLTKQTIQWIQTTKKSIIQSWTIYEIEMTSKHSGDEVCKIS